MAQCPECGSQKTWKDGVRKTAFDDIQRFLCRVCGYRFSESKIKFDVTGQIFEGSEAAEDHADGIVAGLDLPSKKIGDSCSFSRGKQVGSHDVSAIGKSFNTLRIYSSEHQVCASNKKAKNLNPTTETKTVAGDSTQTKDVKGYLTIYAAKQLTMGLKEKTVKNRVNALKLLRRHGADLFNPLSVFKAIDNAKKIDRITGELKDEEWSDATKYQAADAYLKFCDLNKIPIPEDVNLRKFRSTQKLPWLPQEKEIDQLIAGCSRKVASFLQLLKETGARCGEAWRLEWIDVDTESGILTINKPEKNGLPRQFKISNKLMCMLNALPKTSQRIWGNSRLNYHRQNFTNQRKRVAAKLQNPRLLRITFHTFRHFFATMEYHKTHGHILHVQERLGHRSILSTMLYTHLIHFERDEYIVKTASNLKEDEELLLAGFEFVTEREGTKIYRKRK